MSIRCETDWRAVLATVLCGVAVAMNVGNLGSFVSPPLIAVLVASSDLWCDALWVTTTAALPGMALGLVLYLIKRKPGTVRHNGED